MIGFNDNNKELIIYGDFRIYKDFDLYDDIIESVSTYNIGDNLIDFISIPDDKLNQIRKVADTSYFSTQYNDTVIKELDCLYLYLVFYSPNRSILTNEFSVKLEYLAKEFRYALDFCCSTDFDPNLNSLTSLQRYYLYCKIYQDNMNTNTLFKPNTRLILEPHGDFEILKNLPKHIKTENQFSDMDYLGPVTAK